MPDPLICLPVSDWHDEAFSVPISGAVGFEGEAVPVPVVDFPFEALDSPEDAVKEALRNGVPLRACIEGLVRARESEIRSDAVKYVLAQIVATKNWLKAAFEMCIACGLANQMGWTQPEMAKRLGISKQALNQGVKKVRLEFGMRQTRVMRDEEAKAKMSKTNFRHFVADLDL